MLQKVRKSEMQDEFAILVSVQIPNPVPIPVLIPVPVPVPVLCPAFWPNRRLAPESGCVWLQIRDEVAGGSLEEDGTDPVLPHCWRGPHAFRLRAG